MRTYLSLAKDSPVPRSVHTTGAFFRCRSSADCTIIEKTSGYDLRHGHVTTLAQNAVDGIQAAEDTLARFNSGSLARKSSMVLICSLSKKDWVTSTPGSTTCVLPS